MKKIVKAFALAVSLSVIPCAFAEHATPGTYENAAPVGLDSVLAVDAKLNPSKDELVIYYVRKDANYDLWALWTWAVPGGDGSVMWDYTQNWSVMDGVAYMRIPLDGSKTGGNKPVSSEGTVGLIVRQKAGWIKDGNDDRIWDINTSNKVVIFERDQNTYAAEAYKPSIKSAELTSLDTIELTFSGKYAISEDGGDSNFTVRTKNGKAFDLASVKNPLAVNSSDNYTTRVTIKLNEKASVSDSLTVSNPAFRGVANVNSQKLSVKLANETVPSRDVKLGAEYANGSVTFKLWAPTSSRVVANLYKKDSGSKADYTVNMSYDEASGVWSGVFNLVDPDGFFYDYTVTNSKGTVTVLDPYAKSMAAYKNKGGAGRGAIVNLESEKALPRNGMDAPYYPMVQREDAIIYEVSVRDFTISKDSGVTSAPGTYNAFVEKLPYLKALGVTHIQLLPVVNFYNNDETDKSYDNRGVVNGSNYNWGYDPHNYFTPEGWYASDAADPYCRVRELRNLMHHAFHRINDIQPRSPQPVSNDQHKEG